MALAIKDRVKETTTTTSTGTYTLGGAVTGFETFTANLSNADTTYYACTDNTDFEVGIGTFTSSGTTLARTTILASSNSNSAVNWSSGTRTIFMTYPADKAVFKDASDNINGTFVGNITGNVTGNTSGTAATVTTAAQSNITSLGTLTTLTVDNIIINGTTIGHATDDTDLITLADGIVTVAGEISVTTLDIGGTNVTSTAAELNVLDGIASIDTDISSVSGSDDTLASAKAIKTYVDAKVTAEDLDVTSDSGTIAIDLDSETLTIAGGTGLASSASSNTITLAVDAAQTGITSLLATDIKIGEDDQTKIDFETADTINFYAGNEKQLVLTDGALTPGTNAILDLGTDALEFKDAYFDGTVEADAITIGGTGIGSIYSAIAGSSSIVTTGALNSGSITSGFGTIDTGSSAITTTGLISGGSLDIDDVLINGTTIGHTDDTDLITLADGVVTVAGEISVTTLDIGGTNVTSTAAELNALDGITAVVGELNALDIGATAVGTAVASKAVILDSNKDYTGIRNFTITGDADVDGTLEADAITVNGSTLASVIADEATALAIALG